MLKTVHRLTEMLETAQQTTSWWCCCTHEFVSPSNETTPRGKQALNALAVSVHSQMHRASCQSLPAPLSVVPPLVEKFPGVARVLY